MGAKFRGYTEASQTTYKGMTEQQSGCREINLHQQHCHQHLITAVEEALVVVNMMRLTTCIVAIFTLTVVFAGNFQQHCRD